MAQHDSRRGKRYEFGVAAYEVMAKQIQARNVGVLPDARFKDQVGIDKPTWARCEKCFRRHADAGDTNGTCMLSIYNLAALVCRLTIPLELFPSATQTALRAYLREQSGPDGDGFPPELRSTTVELCDRLLNADVARDFGIDLLDSMQLTADGEEEGVILIKPSGTFYRPCLLEILDRLLMHGRIVQCRLFNGDLIQERDLFDHQYRPPTMIAKGELGLTEQDYASVRRIYNSPDFERKFERSYDDDLIEPAFVFCDRLGLDIDSLTKRWNEGRAEKLFWNRQYDGLNKVGYQKTVFPIHVDGHSVRLVLNGYIPGYKRLFTAPHARVVAVHFATKLPWASVREEVVGGSSNPGRCLPGSIRYDAFHGKIPLAEAGATVNGQQNVCHASATLLDGMNELKIWFDLPTNSTQVGRVCATNDIPPDALVTYVENQLWDASWWQRDDAMDALMFEVQRRRVTDAHTAPERRDVTDSYATKCGWRDDLKPLTTDVPSGAIVTNAARLLSAGEEFFVYHAGKVLRDVMDLELRSTYHQIVDEIRKTVKDASCINVSAVMAEAIRIAANDLRMIALPVYARRAARADLVRSQVLSELPMQSVQCAVRSERNFIRDIEAYQPAPARDDPVLVLNDTDEWQGFMASARRAPVVEEGPFALLLCGGRSTRMASTIPKPIIPYGTGFMLDAMVDLLTQSVEGRPLPIYCAIGFRAELLQRVLGNKLLYLQYPKTLGVGFRVATCLHELRRCEGPVILSYVDTPCLRPTQVARLLKKVGDAANPQKTFGILTAPSTSHVSGHVVRDNDRMPARIAQERTDRHSTRPIDDRDAGLYVFHNTAEFRDALLCVRNDNVRREFVFADVVEQLHSRGWGVEEVKVSPEDALGINTVSELLIAVAGLRDQADVSASDIRGAWQTSFNLQVDMSLNDAVALRHHVRDYVGPLYFFHWWDKEWN